MTPTEKRLREALEQIALSSRHIGDSDDGLLAIRSTRIAHEALAAIPSETGGKERTVILGNQDAPIKVEMANKRDEYAHGYAHGYRNGHHDGIAQLASLQNRIEELTAANRAFYSSHASLRERVVEECAQEYAKIAENIPRIPELTSLDWEIRRGAGMEIAAAIRALTQSPPVSGEKEKSEPNM